jgi:hypothetical protein
MRTLRVGAGAAGRLIAERDTGIIADEFDGRTDGLRLDLGCRLDRDRAGSILARCLPGCLALRAALPAFRRRAAARPLRPSALSAHCIACRPSERFSCSMNRPQLGASNAPPEQGSSQSSPRQHRRRRPAPPHPGNILGEPDRRNEDWARIGLRQSNSGV